MKSIVFHVEAEAEFEQAIDYYENKRPGLGPRFQQLVFETLERIQANPERGTRFGKTQFRYLVVRPFQHVVFYTTLAEQIFVSSISLGRRRPGHWRKRKIE